MSGTRIEIEIGNEGPSFDPYGWKETTVQRLGRKATLRTGDLSNWVIIDGYKVDVHDLRVGSYEDRVRELAERFRLAVGMTASQAANYYQLICERCPACGCRRMDEQAGFPGESFMVCSRCGALCKSFFNLSAVE